MKLYVKLSHLFAVELKYIKLKEELAGVVISPVPAITKNSTR
jgi:hypothetical protein